MILYFCKQNRETLVQEEIQQNQKSQQYENQGSDSLGFFTLHPSSANQTLVFPYKKISAVPQKTTIVQTVITKTDTVSTENAVLPVANDSIVKKAEELRAVEDYFPYPKPKGQQFEPNFTFNLFEYGDSVDYSHQLHKKEITFISEFNDKVFTINYKKINDSSHNWMFWLILLGLIIFGWTRLLYRKQVDLMFSSIFYQNFANKGIRNASENSNRLGGILQVIFSINIALFSFQVFDFFRPLEYPGLKSTIIVMAIAIGFLIMYGIKDFIYKTFGYIFAEIAYVQEYLFNLHMYNRVLGLFLFPVIVSFAFIQTHIISHRSIMFIGFALIVAFFVMRIIRGIQISFKSNISIVYMFLYFCILEILPIALLVKTGSIVLNMLYL